MAFSGYPSEYTDSVSTGATIDGASATGRRKVTPERLIKVAVEDVSLIDDSEISGSMGSRVAFITDFDFQMQPLFVLEVSVVEAQLIVCNLHNS